MINFVQQTYTTADLIKRNQDRVESVTHLQSGCISAFVSKVQENQRAINWLIDDMRGLNDNHNRQLAEIENEYDILQETVLLQNKLLANLLKGAVALTTALQMLRDDLQAHQQVLQTALRGTLPMGLSGTQQHKICNPYMVQSSTAKNTCALGLFKDLPSMVKKHCMLECYESEFRDTEIIPLGRGRVLLSTQETNWAVHCATQSPRIITSCEFCIVYLNCSFTCSLRGIQDYIPPVMENCEDNTCEALVRNPINALTYLKFYDEIDATNFTGHSFQSKENNISCLNDRIPPFMTWTVRDTLDKSAQESLVDLDHHTIREVITILEKRTLLEIPENREEEPPPIHFSLVAAIWWLLHRNIIRREDYDDSLLEVSLSPQSQSQEATMSFVHSMPIHIWPYLSGQWYVMHV